MRLGSAVLIHFPVKNLKKSLMFFEKLGYKKIAGSGDEAMMTDGLMVYKLESASSVRAGLTYFSDNWASLGQNLKQAGLDIEQKVADPNGVVIKWEKGSRPAAEGRAITKCGTFYELSIETEKFDETVAFWQKLGFEIYMHNSPETRWLGMQDDWIKIGIYEKGQCPHVFRTPAITYFEADMPERLKQLRGEQFEFVQEIQDKQGITAEGILQSPDEQMLFLFKV
ncbi:hypothetical protein K1X84_13170 [bacterium]|nr:hypothetical protein [bacterium]